MSTLAFNRNRSSIVTMALLAGSAAIVLAALGSPAAAQTPAKEKIPELGSISFAWLGGGEWRDPPAGLRGPIRNDPEHPYHGNNDGPGTITVRISNWKDPILKPWAAAQMKA